MGSLAGEAAGGVVTCDLSLSCGIQGEGGWLYSVETTTAWCAHQDIKTQEQLDGWLARTDSLCFRLSGVHPRSDSPLCIGLSSDLWESKKQERVCHHPGLGLAWASVAGSNQVEVPSCLPVPVCQDARVPGCTYLDMLVACRPALEDSRIPRWVLSHCFPSRSMNAEKNVGMYDFSQP